MPPNARPAFLHNDHEPVDPSNIVVNDDDDAKIASFLDKQADTDGLSNINGDAEDWTDVKHSERKKRDRIVDDGVLLKLMRKSDYQGFKRLFINLSCMALTAHALDLLQVRQAIVSGHVFVALANNNLDSDLAKRLACFVPLYFFYGFQFQCFAFAGQHEFLHRNAFKTKWINDLCLFLTGVFCFELGAHERVMHKQHHTFTNNIDKDPELTSFYTREQLENPGFRNLPFSRMAYFRQFFDIFATFKCRAGRILFSAMGVPVDYSGFGWSLQDWTYSKESGIMRGLQMTALAQIAFYVTMFATVGQTRQGLQGILFWWIVPVLLGYPVVNYVRNLEHADCEVSKMPNCLLNTRSVRSNLFIRTLLWDTNYHAEHHCYPMVPFFNLHKINELMYDHVVHNEKDHFTTQNWAAVMPGGWLDQQAQRVVEFNEKKKHQKRPKAE